MIFETEVPAQGVRVVEFDFAWNACGVYGIFKEYRRELSRRHRLPGRAGRLEKVDV